jgi:hypothetical protein
MVSRQYDVFHIMVEEGSYYRTNGNKVVEEWTSLLGERAIRLSDHTKISEVIVSALQVLGGEDISSVVSSWDASAALTVSKAIHALTGPAAAAGGVVRF